MRNGEFDDGYEAYRHLPLGELLKSYKKTYRKVRYYVHNGFPHLAAEQRAELERLAKAIDTYHKPKAYNPKERDNRYEG